MERPIVKKLTHLSCFTELIKYLEENGVIASKDVWDKNKWDSSDVFLARVVSIGAVIKRLSPGIGHSKHDCQTCSIVPVTKTGEELDAYRLIFVGGIVLALGNAQLSTGNVIALFNPLKLKNCVNQLSCTVRPPISSIWICNVPGKTPTRRMSTESETCSDNGELQLRLDFSDLSPISNQTILDTSRSVYNSEGSICDSPQESNTLSEKESCMCNHKDICWDHCHHNGCRGVVLHCCHTNVPCTPIASHCSHSPVHECRCSSSSGCKSSYVNRCPSPAESQVTESLGGEPNERLGSHSPERHKRQADSGVVVIDDSDSDVEIIYPPPEKKIKNEHTEHKCVEEKVEDLNRIIKKCFVQIERLDNVPSKTVKILPKEFIDKTSQNSKKYVDNKSLNNVNQVNEVPSTSKTQKDMLPSLCATEMKKNTDVWLSSEIGKQNVSKGTTQNHFEVESSVNNMLIDQGPCASKTQKDMLPSLCATEMKKNTNDWLSSEIGKQNVSKGTTQNQFEVESSVNNMHIDQGPCASKTKKDMLHSLSANVMKKNTDAWLSSEIGKQTVSKGKIQNHFDFKPSTDVDLLNKEKSVTVHRYKYLVRPYHEPEEFEKCQVFTRSIPVNTPHKAEAKNQFSSTIKTADSGDRFIIKSSISINPEKTVANSKHEKTEENYPSSLGIGALNVGCETGEKETHKHCEMKSNPSVESPLTSNFEDNLSNNVGNNEPNEKIETMCSQNKEGAHGIVSDDQGTESEVLAESQFTCDSIETQEIVLYMRKSDIIQSGNSGEEKNENREHNTNNKKLIGHELNQTEEGSVEGLLIVPTPEQGSQSNSKCQNVNKMECTVQHIQREDVPLNIDLGKDSNTSILNGENSPSIETKASVSEMKENSTEEPERLSSSQSRQCAESLARSSSDRDISNNLNGSNDISDDRLDSSLDLSVNTIVVDIPNNYPMPRENYLGNRPVLIERNSDLVDNEVINGNSSRAQEGEQSEVSEDSSDSSSSSSGGSISDISVAINNASEDGYTLAAFFQRMEPELMRERPFDLVSGHCAECHRFIPYSQLIHPNCHKRYAHCTFCSEQGQSVECTFTYFFTVRAADESGSTISVLITRTQAERIVDVPIDVYLSSDEVAIKVWKKVMDFFDKKKAMKQKLYFPVVIRKLRSEIVVVLSEEIKPANV